MHQMPGVVPLYTAAEVRTLDRLAVDEIGIPGIVLMERAGLGAAAEILAHFPESRRVAIVCGPGNNGGDGFVVARHLAGAGRLVDILLVEAESKVRRESRTNLQVARQLEIPVRRVNVTKWRDEMGGFDLIVDAMLGTGASGSPRPNTEAAIKAIYESGLPVVSIDIPSGVDASSGVVETMAVRADLTLTFHAPKVGLAVAPGRFHAGRVKVIDIGIPAVVESVVDHGIALPQMLDVVPPKPREGSKYDAGSVVCVGGSSGMSGAIRLAAQAAMRAGAGIAWGIVPESIAADLDAAVAEVQFTGAISDQDGRLTVAAAERMKPTVERADATVFGPGLGRSEQTRALARWMLSAAERLVIDADGIAAFEMDIPALSRREGKMTLLTPHEGEMSMLLGQPREWVKANRLHATQQLALQARCTVLLKGEDTIVCDPNGTFLVVGSHRSLATAGSGDVLAGVAGAFLAKGLMPLLAGACAALALTCAAELAAAALSPDGVMASDLLMRLPRAIDRQHAARQGRDGT